MRLLATFIVLGAIAGCSASGEEYSLEIWNESGEKVSDVKIWYGDQSTQFGVVSEGAYAVKHYIKAVPPALARIEWVDESGYRISVPVDLSESVPRDYAEGQLTFRIQANDTVKVTFQKLGSEFP